MSSDMRRGIGSCGIRNIPWHSISTVESRSDYVMKTGQRLVSFPCRGPQRVQAVFHSFSTMSNLAYSPDLPHYVPFEAGDFVDYYSASTSSWIPAKAVEDHEMGMKWHEMTKYVCRLPFKQWTFSCRGFGSPGWRLVRLGLQEWGRGLVGWEDGLGVAPSVRSMWCSRRLTC